LPAVSPVVEAVAGPVAAVSSETAVLAALALVWPVRLLQLQLMVRAAAEAEPMPAALRGATA
jgi:hypothetical protein